MDGDEEFDVAMEESWFQYVSMTCRRVSVIISVCLKQMLVKPFCSYLFYPSP